MANSSVGRRSFLRTSALLAIAGASLAMRSKATAVGDANPLKRAKVVWHMANLEAENDESMILRKHGKNEVALGKKLGKPYYADSLQRGSDGLAAVYANAPSDDFGFDVSDDDKGWLSLGAEEAAALRFKESTISLYVRAFLKEPNGWGTLFFSTCIGLAVHQSGLAIAFVRQRTKAGSTFRELPVGRVGRGIWLDLIVRVNTDRLDFFCNGVLKTSIQLNEPVVTSFDGELLIGAFVDQPVPEVAEYHSFCLSDAAIDTVALWDNVLTNTEIAILSAQSELKLLGRQSRADQIITAYNEFYVASHSKDLDRCRRLETLMRDSMREDSARPVFHLTAPVGWIFDPAGAFYFQGKYHVFSYHNIFALLRFCSHDHYSSDDLVHWRMWPTGPIADDETDCNGIYLSNHTVDREGLPNIIYGGFDAKGEQGIRAISHDGMISYTDKRVILPEYHDGHVWKDGDIWYAITMRRIAKKMPKDPEVVMFSSTDLDHWKERGVLFRAAKYLPGKDLSGMEFPYLFSLGGKDVLMAGCQAAGSLYWIGRFDKNRFTFVPDGSEALRVDYANPGHCFNPSIVDLKGAGGESRRIIMALYPFIKGSVDGLPWNGAHAMPRLLTLDGHRLRQDPLPEFESLRGQRHSFQSIAVTSGGSGYVSAVGDTVEINAEFHNRDASTFGMKVRLSEDGQTFVRVFYDAKTNEYGIDGNLLEVIGTQWKARGPTYISAGSPVRMRIFLDKALVETFVNGQTCTASLADLDPAHIGLDLFSEGGGVICKSLDIWEMRSSFSRRTN
jgi:sucrose-6-phosphate hydrolase SacC (GH32 family)